MDHLTSLAKHWIGFSWSQISDTTFWWGAGTTLLGLFGLAAIPALRGAIAPLTGGASRLFSVPRHTLINLYEIRPQVAYHLERIRPNPGVVQTKPKAAPGQKVTSGYV